MTRDTYVKYGISINGADEEKLRRIAKTLLEDLWALRHRSTWKEPAMFSVIVRGNEIASGSQDYCVGYADACNNLPGPCAIVTSSSGMIVYPEERWGEHIDDASGNGNADE